MLPHLLKKLPLKGPPARAQSSALLPLCRAPTASKPARSSRGSANLDSLTTPKPPRHQDVPAERVPAEGVDGLWRKLSHLSCSGSAMYLTEPATCCSPQRCCRQRLASPASRVVVKHLCWHLLVSLIPALKACMLDSLPWTCHLARQALLHTTRAAPECACSAGMLGACARCSREPSCVCDPSIHRLASEGTHLPQSAASSPLGPLNPLPGDYALAAPCAHEPAPRSSSVCGLISKNPDHKSATAETSTGLDALCSLTL